MTISSQAYKIVADGDGAQTVFNYNFYIPTSADVEIVYTDASGVETTLTPSQYTITGIGSTGGTVTYPLVGSPIASGTTLTIARNLTYTQLISIANQGAFYPSAVESALDYLTMLSQQLYGLFSRSIVAPISDPDALLYLPTIAQRANQLLGFDSAGNPVAALPSSALVSVAMQPVVAAATIALARTALGLGDLATLGVGGGLLNDGTNATVNFPNVDVTTAQAPTNSSHLKQYNSTGPITFTLARANTYWNGFGFWINAVTGTTTVAIDSHDTVEGQASGVGFVLPEGWRLFIYTNAAASGTWYTALTKPDFNYIPAGVVIDYAGATAPNGWLLCYGQNVSRTAYAKLFTALGTTWGVGDGSTTFGLPDYRGRIGAGRDDMGGSAANRLTNTYAGFVGTTLGAAGGDQRMQAHTHDLPVFQGSGSNLGISTFNGNAPAYSTTSTGAGSSQNVQPTVVVNKIIYSGVYS